MLLPYPLKKILKIWKKKRRKDKGREEGMSRRDTKKNPQPSVVHNFSVQCSSMAFKFWSIFTICDNFTGLCRWSKPKVPITCIFTLHIASFLVFYLHTYLKPSSLISLLTRFIHRSLWILVSTFLINNQFLRKSIMNLGVAIDPPYNNETEKSQIGFLF